jgi:hypothetical protein
MAHRKICNAITLTNSQPKRWSVLSMHLLNSVLQGLMPFDDIGKGNLHTENIIFVIKGASQTN